MNCELNLNLDTKLVKKMFEDTKTIAVVGLSENPDKASHMVAKYMQDHGYKIVPIYPKGDVILGEKVYKSIDDVPFDIDMVNIFRKSDAIPEIINNCAKSNKNIKYIWVQLGLHSKEAKENATKHNFEIIQNACLKIEHHKNY